MMNFFWFRRDLRLNDNAGLFQALSEGGRVLPVFIFDQEILERLEDVKDRRVQFIYEKVSELKVELQQKGSDLLVRYGRPLDVWKSLLVEFKPEGLYTNHDYEPVAIVRDLSVESLCKSLGVHFQTSKDHVIFEKDEIVTEARMPYTVYTPYKKKWLQGLSDFYIKSYPLGIVENRYEKVSRKETMISLGQIGFKAGKIEFPPLLLKTKTLKNYAMTRDFPSLDEGTSRMGIHLRFGSISIRELVREAQIYSPLWLSELIWREFFMQVLYHFPFVEKRSFREGYEKVAWRECPEDFARWREGMTGYPMVDAGMRELNATGYMHNRVRMVTASFLTKHLLMHWYLGERYFARKLLDYDLAANNGNWQWSAGTGCDAAPYFRIFNPQTQFERFDKSADYVRKWVPEFGTSRYPAPIVDHVFARQRALAAFQRALKPLTT